MTRCRLYGCPTRAVATLETPRGRRVRVCGRHARAAADRGWLVVEGGPDDE